VVDKRPTELHAALHTLLGLGVLDAARDRLKAARTPLDARVKTLGEAKTQLLEDLATVGDGRARSAEALLANRSRISVRSRTWSSATTAMSR
jgi:hypothetical protein